jgi:quinol monooxygenase YgiN
MITRVVKLTFHPENVLNFLAEFEAVKLKVVHFPGCQAMKLLTHTEPGVYFTISTWENEEALEAYRYSDTFISLWGTIKPMFSARAEAWTLTSIFEGKNEKS